MRKERGNDRNRFPRRKQRPHSNREGKKSQKRCWGEMNGLQGGRPDPVRCAAATTPHVRPCRLDADYLRGESHVTCPRQRASAAAPRLPHLPPPTRVPGRHASRLPRPWPTRRIHGRRRGRAQAAGRAGSTPGSRRGRARWPDVWLRVVGGHELGWPVRRRSPRGATTCSSTISPV
jgi:hypothetical protein